MIVRCRVKDIKITRMPDFFGAAAEEEPVAGLYDLGACRVGDEI